MSTTDRRDVIDVLAGDHRAVEEICRQLEAGRGGPDGSRKSLVDTLALELAWHCAAARRFLMPLARRALPDGEALADEHAAEHLTVEHMVRDLEAKDPSDPRFEPLLAQLVAAARGHIEHEERITFAELARQGDPEELLAAGEQLTRARLRAADDAVPASSAALTVAAPALAQSPVPVSTSVPASASAPVLVPAQAPAPAPAPSVVDRVRAVLAES